MTTERLFELFCKQNTNGVGRKERRYIERYGDVPFEDAFVIYLKEINQYKELKDKIAKFEQFLIDNDAERIQSNVSESRYYRYNGIKYRFSSHTYPTGSMTDKTMGVIDLAADPELINEVKY